MALKIIEVKKFKIKLKCSIHASGKLGFSESAAERINFEDNKAIQFAEDENRILYLIPVKEENENSFKANKAGQYYNINTKVLFDNLGYDYKNNSIWFDMIEQYDNDLDKKVFKLLKTEKPRKNEDLE